VAQRTFDVVRILPRGSRGEVMTTHPQSSYAFWEFCDHARCTPTSPDQNLSLLYKNFYKHPQRHELRSQWVVDRAKKLRGIRLHLESVIDASKREEEQHRNAEKRHIATIRL
jgi:hypothetical protein